MPEAIDHLKLYRLPWSLTDNPIAWLEPTQACNLACDGCYRQNVKAHKPIAEVQAELDTFARLRNFDGVSIAGGDPVLHPEVVEIVRRVRAMDRKAIINTNGVGLTIEMLRELKAAGLVGLTFHVDSHQGRPGWRGRDESGMNELRSQYAEMVARVGGLACAFNATVYEDTLEQVPAVAAWAARNIDTVNTVVFITYRAAVQSDFDYQVQGKPVDVSKLVYSLNEQRKTDISARDVARVLHDADSTYAPCAYLNGTVQPDTFKWLLAMRVGTPRRIHGYLGAKFMELAQAGHHVATGRYMSYAPPWTLAAGRTVMLGTWGIDAGVRASAARWAQSLFTDPMDAIRRQHMQAVVCIQPIDMLEDGRDNMCDGCPDMTVHEGKLVWSCRLEEFKQYGALMTAVPHGREKKQPASPDSLPTV